MKSYDSLKKAKTLREKAEDLLKIKASASNLPDDVISNLIHDIEVHEVELDMQNEELNKAKIRAEIAAEKYTELYDFAPFGYCTLTKEGRISELNFNAAKLLNKERSLLKKALFSLYVTIESRPTYKHFLEKVFSSHSKQSCEINIKFENHNIKTISFTGISNENGDHCLLTLMDITERKQVEEELRSSHELLHQHIKNSPIYTFIKEVTEKESKVLFASENFIDMIGIPGSEMIGRTMFELFPPNLAAKFTVDDWEVISSNRTIEYEENLNERSYHTIKFPIRSGNKTLLAGYNIDITYNKEAEKKLAEKRHRLAVILQGTNVGTWEWNIQTGETYFNERWAEIIG